ncbi:TetR/AcrR family transcriptional regulator [Aurantimonas sp. MSK8Z-1]|uniref:TetR/AcrR family transcriptional regulator n=1 Tax=Mangrovibrevibacter kandeliae TaxID=2968473 RepID=UPI002119062C|nr:TetR/AcrR family transcriptional regulator [Aurantimonas sp. MSK8Z-1]MCW4116856.1 TetR/AcrR family transcriptional regulator [Aurantimonas sp. MSK8Z-1]
MATNPSDLRERLLETALELLEDGTSDLSLRAVARRAGVSAMAPYRHFPDKASLLDAVAARGFALLRKSLLAADAAPVPAEALVAQGLAYVAFARAHPSLFRLMFAGDARPPGKTAGADPGAFEILANRVASLAPAGVAAATLACWSLVHGLATLSLDGRLAAVDHERERRALVLLVSALTGSTAAA